MTLEMFLKQLDTRLRERPQAHAAQVCFELAQESGATVSFAGPRGQALDRAAYDRWRAAGGPDPFLDDEGRATVRIQASHRITDWVVINARLTPAGLQVDERHLMLRSWVVP